MAEPIKKRVCFRCKNEVKNETNPEIDYPYYCPHCDENLYEFETEIITVRQKGASS